MQEIRRGPHAVEKEKTTHKDPDALHRILSMLIQSIGYTGSID